MLNNRYLLLTKFSKRLNIAYLHKHQKEADRIWGCHSDFPENNSETFAKNILRMASLEIRRQA